MRGSKTPYIRSFARNLLPAAALLGVAGTAEAQAQQQATSAGQDDIVVEGKRKAIETTLKQLLAPTRQGQLARFEKEICPHVFGLPADWTEILTKAIRHNVVGAGGTAGKPGCGPNAIVIFIYEPQELIKAMGKAMPDLLGSTPAEIAALASVARPVTSWHVTDMVSRDGKSLEKASTITMPAGGGGSVTLPTDAYVVRGSAATRHYSSVREDMRLGFVVVDAQAIHGKTLRQLADVATMHLMLDVKPDAGAHQPDSILSLFDARADGQTPPRSMSRTDRAVLSGFYGLKANNYTDSQQRRRIAREASKALEQDER